VHPAAEGQALQSRFEVVVLAARNRDIAASIPRRPHLAADFMNLFLSMFFSVDICITFCCHCIAFSFQIYGLWLMVYCFLLPLYRLQFPDLWAAVDDLSLFAVIISPFFVNSIIFV